MKRASRSRLLRLDDNIARIGLIGSALVLSVAACGGDEVTGPDNNPPTATGPDNNPPTAAVSANPTQVPPGDGNSTIVTIDGSASTDPDGDALSYSWTVPSGTFENGTTAADPTIEVSFPGAAPYTVTLVVDDGNGETDSAQITIGLSASVNQAPTASFTASPPQAATESTSAEPIKPASAAG